MLCFRMKLLINKTSKLGFERSYAFLYPYRVPKRYNDLVGQWHL